MKFLTCILAFAMMVGVSVCESPVEDPCGKFTLKQCKKQKKTCKVDKKAQPRPACVAKPAKPAPEGCARYNKKKNECQANGCKYSKKKCLEKGPDNRACPDILEKPDCNNKDGCIWDKNAEPMCGEDQRNPDKPLKCQNEEIFAKGTYGMRMEGYTGEGGENDLTKHVRGTNTEDLACACFEFCKSKEEANNISWWWLNVKGKTNGKCYCIAVGMYDSIAYKFKKGEMLGGLDADKLAAIDDLPLQ